MQLKKMKIFDNQGSSFMGLLEFIMPFSHNSQLTNKNYESVKKRILLALDFLADALLLFDKGHCECFDGHIGDTACQIRASLNLMLFKNLPENISLSRHVETIVFFKNALSTLAFAKKFNGITAGDFFKHICSENPLNLSLLTYLMGCMLLNRYSEKDQEGIPQKVNIPYFANDTAESKTYVHSWVIHLQRKISRISCDFILDVAKHFGYEDDLESLVKNGDEGRFALPAFVSNYFINTLLLNSDNYLLLKIKHSSHEVITILYQNQNGVFKVVGKDQDHLKKYCYVVYGYSMSPLNSKELQKTISIFLQKLELLDMNFAAHIQYPGCHLYDFSKHIEAQKENDYFPFEIAEKYRKNIALSSLLGCSKENPSLFLVKHVWLGKGVSETFHIQNLHKSNSRIIIRSEVS